VWQGGRILFDGQNLLDLSQEELRRIRGRRIGMVFQEPLTSLNPVFTIGDQIAEVIETHESLGEEAIRARCIQLLKDVGIASAEERLKDYPHQLSGGQRQRVMIAMALACSPDLIIADEPTTALDVTIQAQILNLLNTLKRTRGMSILYITHDLGVVAAIASRVFVMYAGTVVEQGPTSWVFSHHSIPGSVPNPAFKPRGCPFHPRCSFAETTCRQEFPEFCDYGNGHLSRCSVLYHKQGRKTQ